MRSRPTEACSLLAVAVMSAVLLSGCGPRALCDCAWSGAVTAWFDTNENGVREEDEPPLPGVTIRSGHGEADSTNPSGEALFDIWSPGCPCTGFDLYFEAVPPTGYTGTTPERIEISDEFHAFGFAYDPASATRTPNPIEARCVAYYGERVFSDPYVTDLEIDLAGHIWISTLGGGVYEHIPGEDFSRRSPILYAESIAVGPDGSIWVGGYEGVAVTSGSDWASLRSICPSEVGHVADIALDPHGTAWLATAHGILRVDIETRECSPLACISWRQGPSSAGVSTDSVERIVVAPDGSIWALTFWHLLSRIDPAAPPSGSLDCPTYSPYVTERTDDRYLPLEPEAIAFGSDGALWLAGGGALARFDPSTGQTDLFDVPQLSQGATPFYTNDLTVYPDGSLLIGTASLGLIRYWPDEGGGDGLPPMIYDASYGLSHNRVVSISVGADESVWLGTFNGITHCWFEDP